MNPDLVILLAGLFLSGFFSGTETAFTASGRLALEVYHRHRRPGASPAKRFFDRPGRFFTATLVGNNLVGVIYSSFAALFLQRIGVPLEGIVIISPLVLLLVGEIVPKSLARERPERWAMVAAWPLWIFYYLAFPLVLVARMASHGLLNLFGQDENMEESRIITSSDLRFTWRELQRSGMVAPPEAKMLDRIMDLRDARLKDLMTPRTSIIGLSLESSVSQVEELVQSSGFSRIPVYRGDLDHIVGIIVALDLLSRPAILDDILRPVFFFPEIMPVRRLIERFRRGGLGMAVAVDEHGGTAGIITLEDLIETIVGEIEDEYDRRIAWGREVARGAWLVPGDLRLDILKARLGIGFPEGDYGTIGGMITSRIGRIPDPGETVTIEGITIRIAAASESHVEKVLIRWSRKKQDTKSA